MIDARNLGAWLLAGLLACNGGSSDDTADTAMTDGTGTQPTSGASDPTAGACPDQTVADSCCCFESIAEGLATYCMPEQVCGLLFGECVDKQGVDCNVDDSEASTIDCMIAALQAGDPGSFSWLMPPRDAPFDWDYSTNIYLGGDGTMFWLGYLSDSDFSTHYDGVERYDLASLDLAACAAMATADAKFDCLRAAFTSATPTQVCIEPYVLD